MRIAIRLIIAATLTLVSATYIAASTLTSPYAGEEARVIKSLSAKDIDDLLNGRGWGLAKPAELNGVPGPAHLLEMKSEINLSVEQVSAIEVIWSEMNQNARRLGEHYVALERELNEQFATGQITSDTLKTLLLKIATVQTELRYTHLFAHLQASPILKPAQVALYNRLRGYSSDDPCLNIPEGHDPNMWKKHNNCE
jgi:Spy/CpxP family protein refolding chaperone